MPWFSRSLLSKNGWKTPRRPYSASALCHLRFLKFLMLILRFYAQLSIHVSWINKNSIYSVNYQSIFASNVNDIIVFEHASMAYYRNPQ